MIPRNLNDMPKDLFDQAIAECDNSQLSSVMMDGSQSQQTQTQTDLLMTQNELTQLGDHGDDCLLSPPSSTNQQPVIDYRTVSWGRLVAEEGEGRYELTPRDPTDRVNHSSNNNNNNNSSSTAGTSASKSDNKSKAADGGILFLHCLEGITPRDKFNEYKLGRNSKMDISVQKPSKVTRSHAAASNIDHKIHEWAHSMVSNHHCSIYCMLKPSGGMDVFCEDTSGNGTIINGTILLKRGEKRLLHTGDEICLVNPHPLRKKIRSHDTIQQVQRRYTYIFVNVYSQQQANFMSSAKRKQHQHNQRDVIPAQPPSSSSSRRGGIVDVRSLVHHSMDRVSPPKQSSVLSPAHPFSINHSSEAKRVEEFYDIRDTLGTGTCGEVKRAISRKTGKEFAVKIISLKSTAGSRHRSSLLLSEKESAALKAEASILQTLDHPYVVKLYDVFVNPGVAIYLVMELINGGDLFDRIVKKGRYTEVESRRAMRRLLNAIYYLHEHKQLVHRDLKPENILCVDLSNDVELKLTDFGLAKSVTQDGLKTFCGTPQYFAPEVLRRNFTIAGKGRYGKEADMWSIGIILYILLSGTPPFDASTGLDAVVDFKISFPTSCWKGISSSARDLVKQLLIKDPKKRLSVKDACDHPWILMNDGDTHTHPFDDPAAPLKPSAPVISSSPSLRTTTPMATTITSPNRDQDSSARNGTSTPVSAIVSSQVTPSKSEPPLQPLPKDLNGRSNHFRDIVVARSTEKMVPSTPTKGTTATIAAAPVTPKAKISVAKNKQSKKGQDAIKPCELTDDEICSRFSDESRSSFTSFAPATPISCTKRIKDNDNHDANTNHNSAASCSTSVEELSLVEEKENKLFDRDTTMRQPIKKRKMDNVDNDDDETKPQNEPIILLTPKKNKKAKTTTKTTKVDPDGSKKQTTLANWFHKRP